MVQPKKPMPVVYNDRIPPEFFDFIIIDGVPPVDLQPLASGSGVLRRVSHRPDRYAGQPHLRVLQDQRRQRIRPRAAVADGVNVGNEIYVIDTERPVTAANSRPTRKLRSASA